LPDSQFHRRIITVIRFKQLIIHRVFSENRHLAVLIVAGHFPIETRRVRSIWALEGCALVLGEFDVERADGVLEMSKLPRANDGARDAGL
jgi:hypothetical protein